MSPRPFILSGLIFFAALVLAASGYRTTVDMQLLPNENHFWAFILCLLGGVVLAWDSLTAKAGAISASQRIGVFLMAVLSTLAFFALMLGIGGVHPLSSDVIALFAEWMARLGHAIHDGYLHLRALSQA